MFSMTWLEGDAGPGGGLLEGVEVDDHHVDGLDAVAATAAPCSALPRMWRMPPWTLGCRVLTRPSSISGKPVRSQMSFTAKAGFAQGARRAAGRDQLDPVRREFPANSTRPVLSVTLSNARRICLIPINMLLPFGQYERCLIG